MGVESLMRLMQADPSVARFKVWTDQLAAAQRRASEILQPISERVQMTYHDGPGSFSILSIVGEVDLPIPALEGGLALRRLPQPLKMGFQLGGYDELSLRHPVHLERILGGLWRRHRLPPERPSAPATHHWVLGNPRRQRLMTSLVMRQERWTSIENSKVRVELGFKALDWDWAGWAAAHGPQLVWRLSPDSPHPREGILSISISGPTARLAESGWEALEAGAKAFLWDYLTGDHGFKFVEDEERPGEVRLLTTQDFDTSDRDGIPQSLGITPEGFLIEGSLATGRPDEVVAF